MYTKLNDTHSHWSNLSRIKSNSVLVFFVSSEIHSQNNLHLGALNGGLYWDCKDMEAFSKAQMVKGCFLSSNRHNWSTVVQKKADMSENI